VADFGSFLKPVVNGDQQQSGAGRVINVHELSGFCVHRVSSFSDYQTSPFTYSGANVIDAFYDHVLREARSISDILWHNVPICPLDDDQQSSFDAAVTCHNCNTKFTGNNPKTRHHRHVTGNYLFPAAECNNCNLALKLRKSNGDGENNYLVPVARLSSEYAEYRLQSGQVRHADIKIIPLNSEKYLQIQIGNLLFLDSLQFMAASLDTLVGTLRKSGTDHFVHTSRYMGWVGYPSKFDSWVDELVSVK